METITVKRFNKPDLELTLEEYNNSEEYGYCRDCEEYVEVEGGVGAQGMYNACMVCGIEVID